MEEDYTSVWSIANSVFHAFKVESFGFFGEVWVGRNWELDIGEDLVVVCPGWIAEVDCWGGLVEFGDEESAQVNGTCTGYGLNGMCSLFFQSG